MISRIVDVGHRGKLSVIMASHQSIAASDCRGAQGRHRAGGQGAARPGSMVAHADVRENVHADSDRDAVAGSRS